MVRVLPSKTNRRLAKDSAVKWLFSAAAVLLLAIIAFLFYGIAADGVGRLNLSFFSNFGSRFPEQAGIKAALVGTLALMAVVIPVSLFLGLCSAIYLEEYAPKNRWTAFIEMNISNLAGVPSVVFGLLGLTVFVRAFSLSNSILAAGLTMSLLILPIIIVASQEAIRSVPDALREASYGMGATKWQTIVHVVLPSAIGSILTGSILSFSRAIGETAPLIVLGIPVIVHFLPTGPLSTFTALPMQIYDWAKRPQPEFADAASAGIIVLLVILVSMNAVAIYFRNRSEKSFKTDRRNLPMTLLRDRQEEKQLRVVKNTNWQKPVYETNGLNVWYGTSHALKNIDLTINEKEVTAIIGPSGCGKSTYLKTLNRMVENASDVTISGNITLMGNNILGKAMPVEELRSKVGMVFQKPNPFPKSIYENVAFGPKIHGIRNKSVLDSIVEDSLRKAALWDEVKDRLHKSAYSLSGGQQQRLCIARCLAIDPEVILMDEPTSALDPVSTHKVEELINSIKNDVTVAIVTHNMQQAARISDRTAFFLNGEIVECDRTTTLFSTPTDERTDDYINGRFG